MSEGGERSTKLEDFSYIDISERNCVPLNKNKLAEFLYIGILNGEKMNIKINLFMYNKSLDSNRCSISSVLRICCLFLPFSCISDYFTLQFIQCSLYGATAFPRYKMVNFRDHRACHVISLTMFPSAHVLLVL